MSANGAATNGSAEIYELGDARARRRATEIDPANFLAVGPYLEAVREAASISVAAMSERTHIRVSYIEAIERMDVAALPSKAFATGFVRVYADALGLNGEAIAARFKSEAGWAGVDAGRGDRRGDGAGRGAAAGASADREPRGGYLSFVSLVAILFFILWCAFQVTRPREEGTPFRLDGFPPAPEPAAGQATLEPTASRALGAGADATPAAPGSVIEAIIVERSQPVYPPACEATAASIETVTVAFTVSAAGTVVSERVAASSNPCFERAALNALRRWRFEPRQVDGAPRPAHDQTATLRFDRPS